jgi:hypothetical protein
MGATEGRMNLVEKLFEQAFKRKLAQLAREYDLDLVLRVRTHIARNKGGQECFSGWKWTPDMTVKETIGSLDDCLNGLPALLQKHQDQNTKGIKRCY